MEDSHALRSNVSVARLKPKAKAYALNEQISWIDPHQMQEPSARLTWHELACKPASEFFEFSSLFKLFPARNGVINFIFLDALAEGAAERRMVLRKTDRIHGAKTCNSNFRANVR